MCAKASMDEFEALLKESFEIDTPEEGTVVKGRVIAIEAGQAIIDVGYKMEGRIDLKEFANPGENPEINIGDEVEVYLDRVENARGEAVISREKARREEAWDRLEKAYASETRVDGAIFGRVKGGFTVDLGGAVAHQLSTGFVPIRKKGKLPGATISQSYTLEYGEAVVEIHDDALQPGEKVLLVDDLLATGGTAEAGIRLIERLGAGGMGEVWRAEHRLLARSAAIKLVRPEGNIVVAAHDYAFALGESNRALMR